MRVTPLEVLEQTFRLCFRGFDPAEVDGFLQRVADELERLADERDRCRAELEAAREARATMEEALAATKHIQEGILERAQQEAGLVMAQARSQAERILGLTNEDLARVRSQLAEAGERRQILLAEVEALGRTLVTWALDHRGAPEETLDLVLEKELSGEDPAGVPEDPSADPE